MSLPFLSIFQPSQSSDPVASIFLSDLLFSSQKPSSGLHAPRGKDQPIRSTGLSLRLRLRQVFTFQVVGSMDQRVQTDRFRGRQQTDRDQEGEWFSFVLRSFFASEADSSYTRFAAPAGRQGEVQTYRSRTARTTSEGSTGSSSHHSRSLRSYRSMSNSFLCSFFSTPVERPKGFQSLLEGSCRSSLASLSRWCCRSQGVHVSFLSTESATPLLVSLSLSHSSHQTLTSAPLSPLLSLSGSVKAEARQLKARTTREKNDAFVLFLSLLSSSLPLFLLVSVMLFKLADTLSIAVFVEQNPKLPSRESRRLRGRPLGSVKVRRRWAS